MESGPVALDVSVASTFSRNSAQPLPESGRVWGFEVQGLGFRVEG